MSMRYKDNLLQNVSKLIYSMPVHCVRHQIVMHNLVTRCQGEKFQMILKLKKSFFFFLFIFFFIFIYFLFYE
jgi:hypothetical protein